MPASSYTTGRSMVDRVRRAHGVAGSNHTYEFHIFLLIGKKYIISRQGRLQALKSKQTVLPIYMQSHRHWSTNAATNNKSPRLRWPSQLAIARRPQEHVRWERWYRVLTWPSLELTAGENSLLAAPWLVPKGLTHLMHAWPTMATCGDTHSLLSRDVMHCGWPHTPPRFPNDC